MKLDRLVLILVILVVMAWLTIVFSGLVSAGPFGLLGIIPLGIVVGIIAVVVHQRLQNKEDDYYRDNIDK